MPAAWNALTNALNSLTWRAGEVAWLRGEEGQRVVTPVVGEAAVDEVAVLQEGLHRQQLDRGDAEPPEVVDDGRVGEAGEGAAQRLRARPDGASSGRARAPRR